MTELNGWNQIAGEASPVVDNVTAGFANFNDTLTGGTPIVVPSTETPVPLTNNGLGSSTVLSLPAGISNVYNVLTSLFDFSQLSTKDMVDIRVDLLVTTALPNTTITVDLQLGQGSGSAFNLPWVFTTFKTAKTHVVNRSNWFYVGDDLLRLNPGQFLISADTACTVVVRSWAVRILKVL